MGVECSHSFVSQCELELSFALRIDTRTDRTLLCAPLMFCSAVQKCVRRRAARSIVAVTKGSYEEAYEAIDAVWDTCYYDTAPFDEVPW
jgi:hypothetical protein